MVRKRGAPLLARLLVSSAPPAVVIEVAETIKAALQVFRSVALFLGHTTPRDPPAPLEMSARVVIPTGALKAATEALFLPGGPS